MDKSLKVINKLIFYITLKLNGLGARIYKLQCRSMKKHISAYIKNHPNECKLQIGTGQVNKLEGWLNTDYCGPIYLDAGQKFMIEDNTFDFIFSEHPALNDVERHQCFIPAEFNLLETMVVEATKV